MNKPFFTFILSLCLGAMILGVSPVLASEQPVKPQATRLLVWNGWNKTVSWFKNIITPKKTTTTQSVPVTTSPVKPQVLQPTVVSQPKAPIENKANNKTIKTSPVLKTQPKKIVPAAVTPAVAAPPASKVAPVVKTLPVVTIPIETISNVLKEEPKITAPKIGSDFNAVVSTDTITTGVEIQIVKTTESKSVAPIDLGAFRNTVTSYAQPFDINDNNEVVGSSLVASDVGNGVSHAFLWKENKMTDLGTLGDFSSTALAINNKGQIVGYSDVPIDQRDFVPGLDQGGRLHAVLWEKEQIKDLGAFPNSSDLYSSTAYDINNNGQIVGELNDRAVLWENGEVKDLGTLGGDNSRALSINDSGKIVGYADAKNGRQHAVLWDSGVIYDISKGTPFENLESRALSINNKNQIIGVGSVKINDNQVSKSFYWENGNMKIIEDGGRFKALNDNGQILSDWGFINNWSLQPFKYGDDIATGWSGFFLMNFNNKGGIIAGKDEEDKIRNYPRKGLLFQF